VPARAAAPSGQMFTPPAQRRPASVGRRSLAIPGIGHQVVGPAERLGPAADGCSRGSRVSVWLRPAAAGPAGSAPGPLDRSRRSFLAQPERRSVPTYHLRLRPVVQLLAPAGTEQVDQASLHLRSGVLRFHGQVKLPAARLGPHRLKPGDRPSASARPDHTATAQHAGMGASSHRDPGEAGARSKPIEHLKRRSPDAACSKRSASTRCCCLWFRLAVAQPCLR